jgi:hypothetical protein
MTEEIRSKSTGSARHTALSVPFFYYFYQKVIVLYFIWDCGIVLITIRKHVLLKGGKQ